MTETYQELKKLQQRTLERKEKIHHDTYSTTDSDYSKVLFIEKNKLFHLLFYGSVMDESFSDVVSTISLPEISVFRFFRLIASKIKHLLVLLPI